MSWLAASCARWVGDALDDWRGQRAQERRQFLNLLLGELDGFALRMAGLTMGEFGMSDSGGRRLHVVANHFFDARELTSVHIRRPKRDVAQARGLERAFEL